MKAVLAAAVALGAGAAWAGETIDRTIVLVSNEIKMTRSADRTPFPDTLAAHPDLMAGGGYRLEEPDDKNEWYARAYQWSPGTVFAMQGERIRLEFFGVNGDVHPTVIEGYDLAFDVRRGEITRVDFVVDKPGIFNIAAPGRQPSMTAQLVVMPR